MKLGGLGKVKWGNAITCYNVSAAESTASASKDSAANMMNPQASLKSQIAKLEVELQEVSVKQAAVDSQLK